MANHHPQQRRKQQREGQRQRLRVKHTRVQMRHKQHQSPRAKDHAGDFDLHFFRRVYRRQIGHRQRPPNPRNPADHTRNRAKTKIVKATMMVRDMQRPPNQKVARQDDHNDPKRQKHHRLRQDHHKLRRQEDHHQKRCDIEFIDLRCLHRLGHAATQRLPNIGHHGRQDQPRQCHFRRQE